MLHNAGATNKPAVLRFVWQCIMKRMPLVYARERDMLRFAFPERDGGEGWYKAGRPFASKGMLFVSAAHWRYPFGQVICLPGRVDGYANRHDHRASSLGWDGG